MARTLKTVAYAPTRQSQPDRQRRLEMLPENKNAEIRGAGGVVGGNKYRESVGGEDD
jgi:hypothetical protein